MDFTSNCSTYKKKQLGFSAVLRVHSNCGVGASLYGAASYRMYIVRVVRQNTVANRLGDARHMYPGGRKTSEHGTAYLALNWVHQTGYWRWIACKMSLKIASRGRRTRHMYSSMNSGMRCLATPQRLLRDILQEFQRASILFV